MKRRILLAEDSDRTRQSLKELLEGDEQVEVETVANDFSRVSILFQNTSSERPYFHDVLQRKRTLEI